MLLSLSLPGSWHNAQPQCTSSMLTRIIWFVLCVYMPHAVNMILGAYRCRYRIHNKYQLITTVLGIALWNSEDVSTTFPRRYIYIYIILYIWIYIYIAVCVRACVRACVCIAFQGPQVPKWQTCIKRYGTAKTYIPIVPFIFSSVIFSGVLYSCLDEWLNCWNKFL